MLLSIMAGIGLITTAVILTGLALILMEQAACMYDAYYQFKLRRASATVSLNSSEKSN